MTAPIWLQQYKFIILLGLIGGILLVIGISQAVISAKKDSQVEIISKDAPSESSAEIVVDVSGAVEKPGVYRLPPSARLNDILVAAGGLSASADRAWVSRFLNLAAKINDGSKIYIPSAGEDLGKSTNVQFSPQEVSGGIAGVTTDPLINNNASGLININTASLEQLDSLWGIGAVRAQAIVDNRPFATIDELKSKAKIPNNVFERIKDQITVN
ncbi:hypothetical protein A3A66_04640 [Microgenomates group bacterium RIFCSPLOWO2_01_FULL_46_13]|nr:MAG: hypothetical protein A2783_05115 [Microgenomates group bacterium RIFCSPHIGHO2_01_FULL_45_11]OGV94256.1 MAG: hypothetical protein A3A66_04640 [Microgenomates group bacterium RIFCSPLOWO2_01_FULL_46_13]